MQAILLGICELNFKSGSTGDNIQGTQLFYAYPEQNTIGHRADKVFIRKDIQLPNMKPNDTINLFFDRKGKVEAVTLVTK